jgi:taurine dioxygenase
MIRVTQLSGALGAQIDGVDLAQPLNEATRNAIRAALLEHLVIFFRAQPLTPEQFLNFARAMGEPIEYPFIKSLPDYPHITEVKKLEHERVNFGGVWHSDTAYLKQPPMGSMLLAREVPPAGGDTLFANQYLAYETLSHGMQRMLEGLRAVHSSAKADASRTREDRINSGDAGTNAREEFTSEHPVVRTHPETGRKALYVNIAHTVRFADTSEAESAPLLRYLFEHQVRPEFTCRFQWQVGSLAFWDNRCTQHNPVNDYHGHRRVMHRITLAGQIPR